jgi:hypothetical protein
MATLIRRPKEYLSWTKNEKAAHGAGKGIARRGQRSRGRKTCVRAEPAEATTRTFR